MFSNSTFLADFCLLFCRALFRENEHTVSDVLIPFLNLPLTNAII